MVNPSDLLPAELWASILSCHQLSGDDILKVSAVHSELSKICFKPEIWAMKFSHRWQSFPTAELELQNPNWFSIYRKRYSAVGFVAQNLVELADRYSIHDHMLSPYFSDRVFNCFLDEPANPAPNDDLFLLFIIDELRAILEDNDTRRSLTKRFYARHALNSLVKKQLTSHWAKGVTALLDGTIVFARWLQPERHISMRFIQEFAKGMAIVVVRRLSESDSQHPMSSCYKRRDPNCSADETLALLGNISMNVQQQSVVIRTLNYVFSTEYAFIGNTENYYDITNSLIDRVIETRMGLPITLCVLYKSVADFLNVPVELTRSPYRIFVRFLEHPELSGPAAFTYIDPFNACHMMSEDAVRTFLASEIGLPQAQVNLISIEQPASKWDIWIRMTRNVTNIDQRYRPVDLQPQVSAKELAVLFSNNLDQNEQDMVKSELIRTYIHMSINHDKVIEMLTGNSTVYGEQNVRSLFVGMARKGLEQEEEIEQNDIEELTKKLRQPRTSKNGHVKYAVGMIMHHRNYDYTCLIRGWDSRCTASSQWKTQMRVGTLERKDKQPFYNVLVNDGSDRYAAEDNLVFEPNPVEINHEEVGRYFDEYCDNHYRMNECLLRLYPDDAQMVARYISEKYGNNAIEMDTDEKFYDSVSSQGPSAAK